MTTTKTETTIRNINPLTVDVPLELLAAFMEVKDDADRLALSTKEMRNRAETAGVQLPHFTRPNGNSTPEHRYSYAILQRMGVEKLAILLGVTATAFEPVFNSATKTDALVQIGGETRKKRDWQAKVNNTLRPVKDAWVASVQSEVKTAREDLLNAELDLKDLTGKADAAEAASKDAETAVAEADAALRELVTQHDAATGKEKAKLAARVKTANKAVEDALSFATMVEEADTAALLAVAEQKEAVEELRAELKAKQELLPTARGAKTRKTESEAAVAKIDALIKTLTESDGTGYGAADLAEAIYHLKMTRACFM